MKKPKLDKVDIGPKTEFPDRSKWVREAEVETRNGAIDAGV